MNVITCAVRALPLAAAVLLAACAGGDGAAPVQAPQQAPQSIAVGEPTPGAAVVKEAFVALAQKETCAGTSNRLFLIDQKYVFWERAGACADNSYAMQLFGAKPDLVLCSKADSIAGPRSSCSDASLRTLFDTMSTVLYDKPNLGLDASHTVEEIKMPMAKGELLFRTVAASAFSQISVARNVVVKDAAALDALWKEHGQPASTPLPKVDFDKELVLGLFAGNTPGCREFQVRSVAVESGRLVVAYEDRDINPVTVCTAALSAPMQLIVVERSAAPVDFVKIVAQDLDFTLLHHSAYAGYGARANQVIRSQAAWDLAWVPGNNGDNKQPPVDFSKHMVVAVFGGGGPSGCYTARVEQVYKARARISVNSVYMAPAPDSALMCTAAVTAPATYILLAQSDDPVEFNAQRKFW